MRLATFENIGVLVGETVQSPKSMRCFQKTSAYDTSLATSGVGGYLFHTVLRSPVQDFREREAGEEGVGVK